MFKNFTILILISILLGGNSYGQSNTNKTATIQQTRQVFKQINEYKNYKIVTIENGYEFLGEATDGGGELKGFYRGDSLKKIIEWVGLSNRIVQTEYYFDKEKLVFVYSAERRFNEQSNIANEMTTTLVFEGRYYFTNSKLIDTILAYKGIPKGTEDKRNFLAISREYALLLKKKII